jgi:hypothetical protein
MSDFYERRDVSAVAAFTDTGAIFSLGFESTQQQVYNNSNIELDISFDGVNIHGHLLATGITQGLKWDNHQRAKVWVKPTLGAGAGPKYVEVMASTR